MARILLGVAAAVGATAALAPAAPAATVTPLPAQERTVASDRTTTRCAAGTRTPRGAVDTRWSRTGSAASLLVRSSGRGDWDLLLLDRRGRALDSARGTGAREAVKGIAKPGQALTIRACRLRGASRGLRLRLDAVALRGLPKADAKASLVEVETPNAGDVQRLIAAGLDLGEDGHGHDITVVTHSPAQLSALKATGLAYEVLVDDLAAHDRAARAAAAKRGRSAIPSGRTDYRTYETIQQELKDLAGRHGGRAKAFALPDPTAEGREISGIEIADDVDRAARDGRPTFFLVAVHHAREWPAAEIAMEHVHDLLGSTDAATAALLQRVRVVVVPVQNPDGYVWSRGNTAADFDPENAVLAFGAATDVQAYRRRTCSGPLPAAAPCDIKPGADSNRNYGPNWGGGGSSTLPTDPTYRGDTPFSEAETEGIHKLLQKTNATIVVSLHTELGAVLRPPGVEGDGPTPEDAAMEAFAQPMADATGYISTTFWQGLGYDGSGITEDWSYGSLGSYTYTFELRGQGFHGDYAIAVEDQWLGDEGQGGMRAALRHAAQGAADLATHSVLDVRSQPGATLKLEKAFKEQTGPACRLAGGLLISGCVDEGAPIELDDLVAFEALVPATGATTWHIPPSTRPFERRDGKLETYTLTCSKGGAVLETRQVQIDRGQKATVGCAAPPATATPQPPAAKPKPKPKAAKRKPCSTGSKKARAKCKRKLAAKKRAAARKRAAAKRRS